MQCQYALRKVVSQEPTAEEHSLGYPRPAHLHPVEARALGVQADTERFHLYHSALFGEVYFRLK